MLAATNSKAMWYLTRGTGLVSLVLLTISVALGVAEVVRYAAPGWPRFVLAALHKNASLLAVAFLAVHIITAVADSFAPIRIVDAFVPFVGSYRPIWLGLGARRARSPDRARRHEPAARADRIPHVARRPLGGVRVLAGRAAARPRHRERHARCAGASSSTSSASPWCSWPSGGASARRAPRRSCAARPPRSASAAIAFGVVAWMLLEPMRPGWARKAGTPTALLSGAGGSHRPRRRAAAPDSVRERAPRLDSRRPARRLRHSTVRSTRSSPTPATRGCRS